MARGKSQVKDVDRGYRALMRRVGSAQRGAVHVGLRPADAQRRYPSGVTVGQVALWHERGGERVPRRPFLSGYMDLHSRRIEREVAVVLEDNVRRSTRVRRRLQAIADGALRGVRAAYWRLRPLDPDTVRSKGSSRPMVDSGLLDRSLSAWTDVTAARALLADVGQAARGLLGRLRGRR